MAVMRLCAFTLALCASTCASIQVVGEGYKVVEEAGAAITDGVDARKNAFAEMMNDDGDEDELSDSADADSSGGAFLQSTNANTKVDAYMEDSASALSNVLGSRWNGKELDKNAKEQTNALLQGIRGHNKAGMLSGMLGALR